MRMTKRGGLTTSHRCEVELGHSYEKVARKLRGKGNEEMLLAERVVLCEGQDDVAVVAPFSPMWTWTFAASAWWIAAASARFPTTSSLVHALGIEYITVSDRDTSTGAHDESVRKRVGRLEAQVGANLYFFVEDVEHALGTERSETTRSIWLSSLSLSSSKLPVDHEVAALRRRLREFTGVAS